MMKKLIIFSVVLAYSLGYSQSVNTADSKYNLTIKSPDAAQLSKHTDIPTSTHTGAVGIDIPLYTIKVGDYTLPISLKYHASGIKVKETASKVGLGWSLSVGGISLSKQIMGAEDKGKVPYINPVSFNPVPGNPTDYDLAMRATGFNGLTKYDTQPDIYSYSAGGSSGEFYFDSAGKIIQIPYNTVKIEGSFMVTDNEGVKYYFIPGNQILNIGGSAPSPDDTHTTDFVISKIVLTSGKEIKFNYSNINYSYLSNYYKGIKVPRGCTVQNGITSEEFVTKTDVLSENVLQSIDFEGNTLKFLYTGREDINNGLSLSKVEVRTVNNTLVEDYSLIKDYFVSGDFPSISGYPSELPYTTKRLKLKEVINNKNNAKYRLQYYEDHPLPNRLSNQTDHVGFYNGKVTNTGIPYVEYGDQLYGNGDNKTPDIIYAISASLKEIQYPTGGKMDIQYELDDFYFEGIEKQVEQKNFMVSNLEPLGSVFSVNGNTSTVNFKITFQSSANPDESDQGTLPEGPHFVGELLDNNNTVLRTFLINKDYEITVDKKPSYKIRIRKSGNVNASHYATLNAQWFEKTSQNRQYNKSVGGIRVQKIRKTDSGNLTHETEFIYKDENNRSTGVYMADDINYSYIQEIAENQDAGTSCEQLVISNSGNFNIATINGKPTVYNKVISRIKNVNNGTESYEIIEEYLNRSHTNPKNARSPLFTYANNQFARGVLLNRKYFNSDKKLIKKDSMTYEFDNHFNQFSSDYNAGFPHTPIRPYFIGLKSAVCSMYDINGNCQSRNAVFYVERYEVTSAWVKKTKTISTQYLEDKSFNEITNYSYDTSYKHINPLVVNTIFPDSDIQTRYQYAYEKTNQKLINANMIGIPLETEVKKNNKTVSKTETKYDDPLNLFPSSALSYDLQTGTAASTEITYDKYDSKGNLQQYTSKDGISTTIIWGYNNTQPIAKIEGAKLSDISQTLIDSIVNASNNDAQLGTSASEQSLISALDLFRNNSALSGYQITTYSYDPLIGVKSITPPSGIREVYIYDTANRLMEIRENSTTGKILKEFKYNYKQ
ncbi:hypothetical protein [Chryseobacterium kwangjuense]|uniref:Sugar-binding protein n=1 Tax=Chryseobacterium kwangjuense TaxID=267125 RepID=A0A135W604_9FLAO|nr:hypothetical protein [Chryseobacterium kwangjuense]KXH80360.1 hypothetical protein AU378_18225 [Chryseobacterium kwangjuense]